VIPWAEVVEVVFIWGNDADYSGSTWVDGGAGEPLADGLKMWVLHLCFVAPILASCTSPCCFTHL